MSNVKHQTQWTVNSKAFIFASNYNNIYNDISIPINNFNYCLLIISAFL